jgi:hypothetical protein
MCIKRSRQLLNAIVLASLILVFTGCALQRNAVRCDIRLEPINMPAARDRELTSNAEQSDRE